MTEMLINQFLSEYLTEMILAAILFLVRKVPSAIIELVREYLGQRASEKAEMALRIASQSFGEAMQRATVLMATEDPDATGDAIGERVATYMESLSPDTVAKIGASRPAIITRAKAELASMGLLKGGK